MDRREHLDQCVGRVVDRLGATKPRAEKGWLREPFALIAIFSASLLFLAGAPFLVDTYNTLNQRAFLTLFLRGNPFRLAADEQLSFHNRTWALDWPYPPLTLLLDLPAWAVYRLTESEPLYQFTFKLPLFLSAIITCILMARAAEEQGLDPRQRMFTWLYLLNPAIVLATTVAGGFDIAAAMLMLLAQHLHVRRRVAASGLAIGTAGALRLYPLILVPLYAIYFWRASRSRMRDTLVYLVSSSAPICIFFLPFIAADAAGLFDTLMNGQRSLGPVATINFAVLIVNPILWWAGYAPRFQDIGLLFVILTVLGLVCIYAWAVKRSPPTMRAGLALLLVFFLVYPKVHGLYLVSLLPLALLQPMKTPVWVWVPGAVWMLLVNGDFGATGVAYWLAPLTGQWVSLVPTSQIIPLTAVLSGLQALIIGVAIVETIRQPSGVGSP